MSERVVLAYSGGLDTSVGFGWLYQQFTTEMNEQRFQELKNIKNKKWSFLLKNQSKKGFFLKF